MTEIEMYQATIKALEQTVKDQQELIGIYIKNWEAAEEELAAIKENAK